MIKLFYLITLVFCSACISDQSEKTDQSEGELIFHSGFESDSEVIIRNNGDKYILGRLLPPEGQEALLINEIEYFRSSNEQL